MANDNVGANNRPSKDDLIINRATFALMEDASADLSITDTLSLAVEPGARPTSGGEAEAGRCGFSSDQKLRPKPC